ncbi:hypothetical protein PR048_022977 [Dryococelus australis]|uniref:Uncharacterized protein n=1 Tax=Dryococelus australis TaxID=614101 RepID=A0ABQ9GSS4_9NEOP|nr:hypothetical protein PR048_022977 [Dryococelus australis]
MDADLLAPVQTRCSRLKNNSTAGFQAVVFKTAKGKTKKGNMEGTESSTLAPGAGDLVDMKKVRHEVFKFAMSGYDPSQKEEAKINLAIKLGAKPPKKKYYNYKELRKMKEEAKEKEDMRVKLQMIGKNNLGKSNKKGLRRMPGKLRKAEKDGILESYGKVDCMSLVLTH